VSTAYFAYGSNLNRGDMRVRCPDARPGVPARLEGWRLAFRGVADIEPAEGRTVHGALWSLSPEDIRALDRYEGAPSNYRRQIVEVETDEGRVTAMTYVMAHRDYLGLPSEWYLGRVEAGFEEWGLPRTELLRALRQTRAELADLGVEDYRPDGRKRMRAVLSDLPSARVREARLGPTP
jgi:gamma-glutamylcyclotransferase (GGCT)/AIG2-like uncharacterized protein YtfP